MAYKPTLEDIVRKLLTSAVIYPTHITLDPEELGGKELLQQLRAALHEIELQDLLNYEDND